MFFNLGTFVRIVGRHIQPWHYAILGLACLTIYFIARPLLLFFIPGIALITSLQKRGIAYTGILIVLSSLSYWISTFWLLKYVPIPLHIFFTLTVAATVAYLAFMLAKIRADMTLLQIPKGEMIALGALGISLLLRLVPLLLGHTPAGADMAFHGLTANAIVVSGSVPEDYSPLLPDMRFGGYPVGFHVLAAYITILSGVPIHISLMIITCLAYASLTLSIYIFLRGYFGNCASACAAILATFLPYNPQFFISWGGNPFVLGMSFAISGLALAEIGKSTKHALLSALFLGSSFLIHPLPAYVAFFLYLPSAIVAVMASIRRQDMSSIKMLSLMGLIIIVILVPFLAPYRTEISPHEREWVLQESANKDFSWHGTISDSFRTIPGFTSRALGVPFMMVALIGSILSFARHKTILAKAITMMGICFLLILATSFSALPFSEILFSERIVVFMLLPLSLLSATILEEALRARHENTVLMPSASLAIIAILSAGTYMHFIRLSSEYSMIGDDDLHAFQWVKENTPEDSMINVAYGEAGMWIPVYSGRLVDQIQVPAMFFEERDRAIRDKHSSFMYMAGKDIPGASHATSVEPRNATPLYAKGGVRIYSVG